MINLHQILIKGGRLLNISVTETVNRNNIPIIRTNPYY